MADDDGHCSVKDCPATYKKHYWGGIDADRDGWFFRRDGTAYCPVHVPAWVEGWRKKRGRKG